MPFYNRKESGRPISIYDEGVLLTSNVSSIDFVGSGVTGSVIGSAVTETISGGTGTIVYNELLTGTGTSFTLAHAPNPTGSLQLFKNGQRLNSGAGNDYTLSGANLIMAVSVTANDQLVAAQYTY